MIREQNPVYTVPTLFLTNITLAVNFSSQLRVLLLCQQVWANVWYAMFLFADFIAIQMSIYIILLFEGLVTPGTQNWNTVPPVQMFSVKGMLALLTKSQGPLLHSVGTCPPLPGTGPSSNAIYAVSQVERTGNFASRSKFCQLFGR